MGAMLRNGHDAVSGRTYRLILAERGLYLIETGQPGAEAGDAAAAARLEPGSYLGFEQVGQMDYDAGRLHLETSDGSYRLTFPDMPLEDVDAFVEALQVGLVSDAVPNPDNR